MGEWYYIGHYGQLGPLTREQVDDLVAGGVVTRETYVWRHGMADWVAAERCQDLAESFRVTAPSTVPPPQPSMQAVQMPPAPMPPAGAPPYSLNTYDLYIRTPAPSYQPSFVGLKSDRSRTAAGILQILLPGVGRMYLGYLAYGVIQLALTVVTCGLLWPWSIIDGIIMLSGGVKLDGYGRQLSD